MRWLAAMLAVLLGAAVGAGLRNRLRRQAEVLRQICLLLRQMRTETAYLHTPFPALVQSLGENGECRALTFLTDCTVQCAAGTAFPDAWRAAVHRFRRSGALPAQAGRELAQLAGSVCGADIRRVDGILALYEQTMERHLQNAEERNRTGGRLCVRVCSAVGLLFGILIV